MPTHCKCQRELCFFTSPCPKPSLPPTRHSLAWTCWNHGSFPFHHRPASHCPGSTTAHGFFFSHFSDEVLKVKTGLSAPARRRPAQILIWILRKWIPRPSSQNPENQNAFLDDLVAHFSYFLLQHFHIFKTAFMFFSLLSFMCLAIRNTADAHYQVDLTWFPKLETLMYSPNFRPPALPQVLILFTWIMRCLPTRLLDTTLPCITNYPPECHQNQHLSKL